MISFADATFSTDRLTYRSVRLTDAETLFAAIDDELTKYWIDWEPSPSLAAYRASLAEKIARIRAEKELLLIAHTRRTGDFVGCVGITEFPRSQARFECDVWVCHAMQGRGYATEMVRGMLDWLAAHTALPHVVYSYTEGNEPSRRIIERLRDERSLGEPWIEHAEKRGKPARTFNYLIPLR